MLKINRLELEDFGPFKGNQTLEFPKEDGVTIVFGENMRGKTTLLNAIRYALFGRILDRGTREISPEQFINWETKEEGKFSFKIALYFEENGTDYELVREHTPKDGIEVPQADDDYTENVYLVKDGTVTGPEAREKELAEILPQQVSRFFLFDGELLQQYEELLIDESEMGQQIREAIERILGVPVLKNGRADIQALLNDAQTKEQEAAQRDDETEQLGTQLETTHGKRNQLESDLSELKDELDGLKEEKLAIQNKLQQLEGARSLVNRRENLEEELEEIDQGLEDKQAQLQEAMADSWRSVLQSTVQDRLETLKEQRQELEKKQTRISVAEQLAERISDGLERGDCPICDQPLEDGAEQHLQSELEQFQGLTDQDFDPEERYDQILRSIEALERVIESDNTDRVKAIISEIDELKARRATVSDDLSEVKEGLESSKEERVRDLNKQYEDTVGEIRIKKDAIEETENELEKAKNTVQDLQDRLDQISGSGLERERARRELYEKLEELFDQGVAEYRDRLRQRVESDASEIFLRLTTEPEYERLKINDNYGLTIIHEDGDEIEVRSAGAEHVVALALMGALQNNAPLQGPIIMDSPFGRLDRGHMENVVEALPTFTDQVMLLVYRDEIDPQRARDILKGQLRKEYTLERVSARHTDLQKGGVEE
nr:AAA family ATPase [Natronomonas sp.]